MDEIFLRRLFRRALVASLSAPFVVACGGQVGDGSTEVDAGGVDSGEPDGSQPNDSGATSDRTDPPHDGGLVDHHTPPGSCEFDAASCQYVLPLTCSDASVIDGGPLDCMHLCHYQQSFGCSLVAGPNGEPSVSCYTCGVGRRPSGLRARRPTRTRTPEKSPDTELGRYFAAVAHLEAASVDAFRILEDELVMHGAPRRLVRAASRAARDEVRHARVTSRLARRFGATPELPRVARRARRSLEAIAIENAAEGCVRETFGALEATWQAATARDPEVRAAMKRIAVDETRHAALAWAVDAWALTLLDGAARRRVANARSAAVANLARDVASHKPAGLVRDAGVLDAAHASRLVDTMTRELWNA